jgi:RNA polymerase primary sigma factor
LLRLNQHFLSLDQPIGDSKSGAYGEYIEDYRYSDPLQKLNTEALKSKIETVLKDLTFREREVLKLRYGLADGYIYTLEEVGKIFSVTREGVRQLEARAVKKLRHPIRSCQLSCFLDENSSSTAETEESV